MAVRHLEVTRREPYAEGREFGAAGAYERIDGPLHVAVDPTAAANEGITDLELAPRDDEGCVQFEADLSLVLPADPARGNGRLLVEVPNRGRRLANRFFNRTNAGAAEPGDGWLYERGWSVATVGWQHDVYESEQLLSLGAPEALIDGAPIRGQAWVEFRPSQHEPTRLLANRIHRPYPAADLDDPEAVLIVRDWEDGPDEVIPRERWSFAAEEGGELVPDREHITLEGGFEPGRYYYLAYATEGAPVVGTGLLALRDAAAFLRQPASTNPVDGGFERAYAFGVSQTGRLLRHFLSLGLNLDEQGRGAFDGLLPHVAGGRTGEFNHRFAQPSQQSTPGFGHLFPFADEPDTDPFTERRAGLLDAQRAVGALPKVIYTNSSAEYWRGDGSLAHIDALGERDLPEASEVRSYLFAGTQHGPGSLPQERAAEDGYGTVARYGFNVVDYSPLLRAALVNLDAWASEGAEPPPSRVPRVEDGTAVARSAVLDAFDRLGVTTPDPDRLWVVRTVELGPDASRGVGRYPAVEGGTYACLVSVVDDDGNELAGIRLPAIAEPTAAHTGWNSRHPSIGAPEQEVPMRGATHFFSAVEVQQRYESRDAYEAAARAVTAQLVADRYLLEGDTELAVQDALAIYDEALARG